jgi:ABC-2 type transport system ATP-binding protein
VLHEPPILFLDEPTSGVDPIARRRFWDLIDGMSSAGTTVFVSTHYLEEAEYCHRLALMNRGQLIALASPRALREGMTEPILSVETGDPARAVEILRAVRDISDVSMFGRAVRVVVADAQRARRELPAVLSAAGVQTSRIEPVTPSLEDVFVAEVRKRGGVIAA